MRGRVEFRSASSPMAHISLEQVLHVCISCLYIMQAATTHDKDIAEVQEWRWGLGSHRQSSL